MLRTTTRTLPLVAALLVGACSRQSTASDPKSSGSPAPDQKGSPPAVASATPPPEVFEESDPVKLTAGAVQRFGIRVEQATSQRLANRFVVPARISLNLEAVARVGSPVFGRILEAKIRAGDAVKQGDPLLVIDSPEFGEAQSDFLQKRAAITVANSALEMAKSGYERAKKLFDESQGIALTEVQKRETDYKGAEGALLSARASAMVAENKLKLLGAEDAAIANLEKTGPDSRYIIRSPLTGRVIERSVTLGELVRPERDSLLIVADLRTLWVVAEVSEAHLKDLRQGSKARVTVSSVPGKTFEGSVSYIASRLDEVTRTVSVRIELPSDGSALMSGMFAQAEISAPAGEVPVLAVPETAIQMIEGKPQLFIPVKGVDNAFVARRVRTGPPIGAMIPILGGLKEGEAFVATGSFILKADLGKGGVQEE